MFVRGISFWSCKLKWQKRATVLLLRYNSDLSYLTCFDCKSCNNHSSMISRIYTQHGRVLLFALESTHYLMNLYMDVYITHL